MSSCVYQVTSYLFQLCLLQFLIHCITDNCRDITVTMCVCRGNMFTEDGKEKLWQAERERSSEGGMTELRLCV